MIVKHHSYKYLLVSIAVVIAIGLSACSASGPGPSTTTNSESASGIAELEDEVKRLEADKEQLVAEKGQLEADNQQLQDQNTQLSADLVEVTGDLREIESLVTSQSYTNTMNNLTEIQSESSDLAAFVYSLPDLPPLPPGLTVSQINDAIEQAIALREILKLLPPPPPLAPTFWTDLDNLKTEFIDMTYWMENLRDLPEFLRNAESLEDLKLNVEGYLRDTENTASDAKSMLEEVRSCAGS